MNELFPALDLHYVFVSPWTEGLSSYGWVMLMGFFVAAACGLVGNYLILRRMALVGDAISHSVLPGLAIGFLLANSRSSLVMFLGAVAAGVVTTTLIELIHKKSRIKQDAAIGITFSTLFAFGVILISLKAGKVDLDQECVLYGEIGNVGLETMVTIGQVPIGPVPVVRMAIAALVTAGLIIAFYKELLVSSFDPGLAFSLGINATAVHYSLMGVLSVVVVSAFESVGAILVIAMLILPGATASLLSQNLARVLGLSVLHAALTSVLGLHLALYLRCSIAGAMVVMGAVLFCCAWIGSPQQGLVYWWLRRRRSVSGVGSVTRETA
jgi:manganese/zinc/iron transport system permease protein